jgi:hypothetical protein
MGPLQSRRFSRRDTASSLNIAAIPHTRLFTRDEPDEMMGRHEPQTLTERAFPRDPYAAWLAQREADCESTEGSNVRWIHRPRGLDAPVGGTGALAASGR